MRFAFFLLRYQEFEKENIFIFSTPVTVIRKEKINARVKELFQKQVVKKVFTDELFLKIKIAKNKVALFKFRNFIFL